MNLENTRTTTLLGVSLLAIVLLCVPMASSLSAQESDSEEEPLESTIGPQTEEEAEQAGALAKAAQNPIAALVSLPLQYNANSGAGEFDRQQATLNIQPVVPFKLGGGRESDHAHHHPVDKRTDR